VGRNGTVMADLFFLLFLAAFLSVGSGGSWEGEPLRRPDIGIRNVAMESDALDVQVGESACMALGRQWDFDAIPSLVTALASRDSQTIVLRGRDEASYGAYQKLEQALQAQGLTYVRLAGAGDEQ